MGTSLMFDPRALPGGEHAELRAKVEALNAEAKARWDYDDFRREVAAEMTETIYWGFQHENILQLFAQVENVGFDDRSLVKETRGMRAHWLARGGYIEASTLHQEVFEIPRDTVGFHVYEFEDKLRTNFAETQNTMTDLGIQRLDAVVNQKVLGMFQVALPIGGPFTISANGLSLSSLNTALRQVRDVSMDRNVALIGRATMTDQIVDQIMGTGGNTAGYFPETNERLLQMGVLGTYRGARIIELKNYRDDMDIPFFPANELWVIGRDASKFAFFGGMLSKEFTEDDAWYWHYLARRDFGGVIYRPNRIRRIVDTATAANLNSGGTYTAPGGGVLLGGAGDD